MAQIRMINPLMRSPGPASNPRAQIVVVRAPAKKRRRNPSLGQPAATPVVMNPLILPNKGRRRRRAKATANPRRRRRHGFRRHRNPNTMQGFLTSSLTGLAASGLSFYANKLVISDLGTDKDGNDTESGWLLRNFVRLVGGAAGAYYMPGLFGSALMGAMGYPAWSEFDAWMQKDSTATTTTPTEALITDTEDVLDGILDDLI